MMAVERPTCSIPQQIYLITYPVDCGIAHWGIFVPDDLSSCDQGTIIHVVGSPLLGFKVNFKRNYNQARSPRYHKLFPLGVVGIERSNDDAGGLVDSKRPIIDTIPRNILEQLALTISPPEAERIKRIQQLLGKLRCFGTDGVRQERARDCQHWIIDYVTLLTRKGILPISALEVLQSQAD